MKKFLISLAFIFMGASAQAQQFPLNIDTTITKPDCLPRRLSPAFSGTLYALFSAKNFGVVHSWTCWNEDGSFKSRYALAMTEEFMLNPFCSTLGIDRFRVVEPSATTSVYNMLLACGRPPAESSAEWDKYVRLISIGQVHPSFQEEAARQFFGENFRTLP